MIRTPCSRRAFLIGTTASLVGAAALPDRAKPDSALRMALAGCGRRGTWLAGHIAADSRMQLVALCDPSESAVAGVRELASRATHASWNRILADPNVDAVVIAAPEAQRAALAIDALHSGKHVWSEAPVAMTLDDCARVEQAAIDAGRAFYPGSHGPFTEHWKLTAPMISNGMIGSITRVQSRLTSRAALPSSWRLQRSASLGAAAEALHHQWTAMAAAISIASDAPLSVAGGRFEFAGQQPDSLLVEVRSEMGFPVIAATSPHAQPEYVHIRGTQGEITFGERMISVRNSHRDRSIAVARAGSPLGGFLRAIEAGGGSHRMVASHLVIRAIAQFEPFEMPAPERQRRAS